VKKWRACVNDPNNSIGFLLTTSGWGGLELNVLKLMGWLGQRGRGAVLYTCEDLRVCVEAGRRGLTVCPIPHHGKYFDFFAAFRFSRHLKMQGMTRIIVCDNHDIDFAAWTKRFLSNRLLVSFLQQMQVGVDKNDILHTVRFSALDYWIAPLSWLRDEAFRKTRIAHDKVKVIPLPIDFAAFSPLRFTKDSARASLGIGPVFPLLGILGRIDPQKGQLLAVSAVAALRSRGIAAHLLIAGELTLNKPASQRYQDAIKKKVAADNLEEVVHFRPFMDDPSVFYAAIDIFVMASEGETYGMVTLEAMAAGIPVVGTSASGTPEMLGYGEFGKLFDKGDCDGLVSRVIEICADYGSARRTAARAQQRVKETFSHHVVCAQIEHLLDLP
jgi:glycosyltransferase involved in cell wall biosynthesis